MKLGKINRKVLCAIKITIFVVQKMFSFLKIPCDKRWFIFKDDLFLLHLDKLSEHQSHLQTIYTNNNKNNPRFSNQLDCFDKNKYALDINMIHTVAIS